MRISYVIYVMNYIVKNVPIHFHNITNTMDLDVTLVLINQEGIDYLLI